MKKLQFAVRTLCALPFVTGAADVVFGASFLKSAGVPLDDELATHPMLDSQVRFWGAISLGYGASLWRASSRLETEPATFRLLCGVLAASGLARVASFVRCGSPGPILTAAMALELIAAPVALVWHARETS